jgi:hypothetical protein
MNRRSFFQRLAGTAAIIALAPRLAFRIPDVTIAPVGLTTISADEIVREVLQTFRPHIEQLAQYATYFGSSSAPSGALSDSLESPRHPAASAATTCMHSQSQ